VAWADNGRLRLWNTTTQADLELDITCKALMSTEGRIYVQSANKITEIRLTEAGNSLLALPVPAGNVMEKATRLFPGCAIQSMLGSVFVTLYPKSQSCPQLRVPELEKVRLVDARFEGNVLMVVLQNPTTGQFDRLVLRFDDTYTSYDMRRVEDITPAGLNFIVLNKGGKANICIHLTEETQLEVFSTAKGADAIKVVKDPSLRGDMSLVNLGGRVGYTQDTKIFTMTMK